MCVCVCVWIYEYKHKHSLYVSIYPTPPPRGGCNTRLFFKRGKIALNSKFSFSLIDCRTKVKEANLSHYLLIADEVRKRWINVFIKGISTKW